MRTCPKCNKTIENDQALFCRYCGTRLPAAQTPSPQPEPAMHTTPAPASDDTMQPVPPPLPASMPPLPQSETHTPVQPEPSEQFTPEQSEQRTHVQPKEVSAVKPAAVRNGGTSVGAVIFVIIITLAVAGLTAFGFYYNATSSSATEAATESYETVDEAAIADSVAAMEADPYSDDIPVSSSNNSNDEYNDVDNVINRLDVSDEYADSTAY